MSSPMKPLNLAMALLLAGATAWAQEPQGSPDGGPDTPPGPGRGVARISLMNGDVSVRRGNSGEVSAAAINAPLSSGDTIMTGSAARAELQFDGANVVRIAASSEVHMGDLEYQHNQLQIALGLVTFTVLRNSQAQSEIDTPNVSIHPRAAGAYRILVRDDGSTEITVRAGEADVSTAQGSEVLKSGQTMMIRGAQNDAEFQIVNASQMDEWDRWNADRDRELMSSTSSKYVNPEVYGTEELDRNGRWVNDGSYGMVWTPTTVGPDWAPYREGHWVWVDGYGWTWASYDPWGWAPYHYGRWYRAGFGWAWWPGPVVGPCYWSPALVGFFGFGGGVGFGFGFGHVGWVPLAPYERFHPWWGRGGFRNTVIVNNVNIYNSYRNARVAGGVTGVAANSFGRGGGRFSAVSASEFRNAGMVRGMLPVTPDRSSLRFSDRSVNMSNFRQSRNTQFFTRNGTSSPVRGTSFEQQRQMVQQAAGGRSFSGSQAGGFQNNGSGSASRGWNRFSSPGAGGANQPSPSWRSNSATPNANGQGGTWNRSNGGAAQQPLGRSGYNSPSPYGGRSYNAPYNGGNASTSPQGGGWNRSNGGSMTQPSGGPGYNPPSPYGGRSYNAPYNGGNNGSVSPQGGGWNRSNGGSMTQPSGRPGYNSPSPYGGRSYNAPYNGGNNNSVRISPPIVRERAQSQPSYSAPRYSPPSYSAPRAYSGPSYSAPRSSPSYGGGGGRPSGGGGGGSRSSGGGGGGHHR